MRRTTTSLASDSEWEVLTTPVLCLAMYAGSQLLGVFPHTDGDTTYSAADAIGSLRTGELPPMLEPPNEPLTDGTAVADRTDRSLCPDCGSGLVNVQGLLTCTDCTWIETVEPQPAPVIR
ncbi:MAG: HTH domain-containing protein [Natrialbaceae archaeon]|nr:HTH domain-containing protein [Natrialbaceae archaeon]